MGDNIFPNLYREIEEEKAERAALKELKKIQRAKEAAKREGFPWFSINYLYYDDAEYYELWKAGIGYAFIINIVLWLSIRLTSDEPSKFFSLNPLKSIWGIPAGWILVTWIFALARMLSQRKDYIAKIHKYHEYGEAGNGSYNIDETPFFDSAVADLGWTMTCKDSFLLGTFFDTERCWLRNKVYRDKRFFDTALRQMVSSEEIYQRIDPRFYYTILMAHLKKHPEDGHKVLEVFDPKTLPRGLRKRIKTR